MIVLINGQAGSGVIDWDLGFNVGFEKGRQERDEHFEEEKILQRIDKLKNDLRAIGKYNESHQKEYKDFVSIDQVIKKLEELKSQIQSPQEVLEGNRDVTSKLGLHEGVQISTAVADSRKGILTEEQLGNELKDFEVCEDGIVRKKAYPQGCGKLVYFDSQYQENVYCGMCFPQNYDTCLCPECKVQK